MTYADDKREIRKSRWLTSDDGRAFHTTWPVGCRCELLSQRHLNRMSVAMLPADD